MATACRCKKCDIITRHRSTEDPAVYQCEVCGTVRHYAKRFGSGDFPELTTDENEIIHEARACGYGSCFAAYPTAEAQARRTLAGARKWLETHSIPHGPEEEDKV